MLVLIAGMAWIALFHTGPVPSFTQFGKWNDKALHAGAFALLAALVVLPAPAPRALLVLALCAAVLEMAQLAFPLRQASFADLSASLGGIITGWFIGAVARTEMAFVTERGR